MLCDCEMWDQHIFNRKDSLYVKYAQVWLSLTYWMITYIKICKQKLCVPKNATTVSVFGELGRCPMYYDILTRVIKYYTGLECMSETFLL